jgi:hypothetical protein
MSTGRLRIARFEAAYLVADGHPAPERLARRLDEVVRKELPDALRAMLAPALGANDSSLWFIRRLDVPVEVNAAWKAPDVARSWAGQISRTLAKDLTGDGDGTNAIRFPDRAAYLARFLVDAASGDAWGQWIYRRFDGLRALPVSAAIRTALADDAALGLVALQRLAVRELTSVIDALTEADTRRILDDMAGDRDATSLDVAVAAAAAQWPSIAASCGALSIPRAALALFVQTTAAGATGGAICVAAEAIAALAAIVRTQPANASSRVRDALAAGDMARVREIAGAAAPLLEVLASPGQLDAACGAVAPAPTGTQIDVRLTRFGGALLLLPQIDALAVDAVAADWPPLGETKAAQMLRWLVLVKSLGRPRADAAFHDPALRNIFRIPAATGWPDAAAWLATLGRTRRRALARAFTHGVPRDSGAAADLDYLALPPMTGIDPIWKRVLTLGAQRVMREFARRLPGFGQSRYGYLYGNFLDFPATFEYEPARIVARLGRPPLHLILGLIGASRATMRFDWLDARSLALFSKD